MTDEDYCMGCNGNGGDCPAAKANNMPYLKCDDCPEVANGKMVVSGYLKARCPKHGKHLWHAVRFKK